MDPENGYIYIYDQNTNSYSHNNPYNLSMHTITSIGKEYYNTVNGSVNVDQQGRIMYIDPASELVYYSNPLTGLVSYDSDIDDRTVYVDPVSGARGVLRTDGYVVFENSAGKNYYVNIRTGVMTDTILLSDYQTVFDNIIQ